MLSCNTTQNRIQTGFELQHNSKKEFKLILSNSKKEYELIN